MLIRVAFVMALLVPNAAFALGKEETCALQREVVAQIQQARLDRVSEGDVIPNLMAANPDWPESVSGAMPNLVSWIYQQRRRDLRKVELGPVVQQQCLDNWEQLKSLSGS